MTSQTTIQAIPNLIQWWKQQTQYKHSLPHVTSTPLHSNLTNHRLWDGSKGTSDISKFMSEKPTFKNFDLQTSYIQQTNLWTIWTPPCCSAIFVWGKAPQSLVVHMAPKIGLEK